MNDIPAEIGQMTTAGMRSLAADIRNDALEARCKVLQDEVCRLRAVLLDLKFGADGMLQPALGLTGSFLSYVLEVRRVCEGNLSR